MKRIIFILLLLNSLYTFGQSKTLDIEPVYQNTPVWCWVTVGEMIFKYYGICCINPGGDYQCGIIALLGPACNINCYNCQVPAGSSSVIQNMLRDYPKYAKQICGARKYTVSSILRNSKISKDEVIEEIDDDRPIIAGISPNGGFNFEPAHVALIIGYEIEGDNLFLIVNDPFPNELVFSYTDPYIAAGGEFVMSGQYRIKYTDFTKLSWTKTFMNIR